MPPASPPPLPVAPPTDAGRLESLDLLRGIAICGIVQVNLLEFSGHDALYYSPRGLVGLELAFWTALMVLAAGKFMAMLSMLFGAGLALSADGIVARGGRPFAPALSRLGWLGLFGMLHAYLLWHGDVLVTYAIAGLAVYGCRNWPPRRLFAAGAGAFSVVILLFAVFAFFVGFTDKPDDWSDHIGGGEVVAGAREAFGKGWPEQWIYRAVYALFYQVVGIPLFNFWIASGMMLWGIAALRSGHFETAPGPRRALRRAASALATGGFLSGIGWVLVARGDGSTSAVLLGVLPFLAAVPFLATGYSALAVAWVSRDAPPGLLRRAFSALGRMALSNYLGQSLILGLVFYGHGLGLIGRLSLIEAMALAPLAWGLQLVVSVVWLKRYSLGPAEWLWRSLAQGRRLPMRRRAGR